jgi:hypothetical protein
VKPKPTATPTAEDELPSLDDFEIDWGPLADSFKIENVRVEMKKVQLVPGKSIDARVVSFNVEATTYTYLSMFFARFYDSEEIELASDFSPVMFDPDYSSGWQVGTRSRAYFLLPLDMSQVKTIRLTKL